MTSPNAGQRDLLGSPGEWYLASSEPLPLDGAWHRFSLYLSSNPHTTLSPTPWSSAQEGLVRPRRMVEPLEDRGQEDFFCGPPGKLQPSQFLPFMVVPFLPTRTGGLRRTNVGRQKRKEVGWPCSSQGSWVTAGRLRQVSGTPATQSQAGWGWSTGSGSLAQVSDS